MLTVRLFQTLAAVLIAVAVFFLIKQDIDSAFVTGVLGICSFFLSIRFTFKPRLLAREAERYKESDDTAEPPESAEESVL